MKNNTVIANDINSDVHKGHQRVDVSIQLTEMLWNHQGARNGVRHFLILGYTPSSRVQTPFLSQKH